MSSPTASVWTLGVAGLLWCVSSHAQVLPLPPPGVDLGQPRPSEEPLPAPGFEPEERKPRLKLPPVTPPSERAPITVGPRFFLQEVQFQGNSVFTDAELEEVAAPYIGETIGTEELQELRNRLTLFYVNNGYINSGAVLPDQQVLDGIVVFNIVEGELSSITVTGNERLRARYVEGRLELSIGPPLNVDELEERIQLMLQDPAIDRIDGQLGPGDKPGDSELKVNVVESQPVVGSLLFSNRRPPSVGAYEALGTVAFRNLTGWGETTSVAVSKTEGLTEGVVDFSVPVTRHDTKLWFRWRGFKSEIVQEPFDELDIRSEANDYAVAITHPVYRTPGRDLTLGLELVRRWSETRLLGEPFSFSPGVQNGQSVVTPLRFTQNYVDRGRDQVFAARSTFSFGLDAFGATINPEPLPDGRYFAWLGQFQWTRRFAEPGPFQLVVRGLAQLTPDALLPLEKVAIGGFFTVRGYVENLFVRDNGWAASLEGRIPLFRAPIPGLSRGSQDGVVELAPFFDVGGAWNSTGPNPSPTTIYGIGVGVRYAPSPLAQGYLYYGAPLVDVDVVGDQGLQGDGIYFGVSLNFQ